MIDMNLIGDHSLTCQAKPAPVVKQTYKREREREREWERERERKTETEKERKKTERNRQIYYLFLFFFRIKPVTEILMSSSSQAPTTYRVKISGKNKQTWIKNKHEYKTTWIK